MIFNISKIIGGKQETYTVDTSNVLAKTLIKEINKKPKYKNKKKNEDIDFDEFISYSENMEYLASYLNLEFFDYKNKLPNDIEVLKNNDIYLAQNNYYIVKKDKIKYLLVHDIRKLNIYDLKDIDFDEIGLASKHTINIFLVNNDEIKSSVNEDKGATDFIKELISIARLRKASEIYFSLDGYVLNVRIRTSQGKFTIAMFGIKEAHIIRSYFEVKASKEAGDKAYDGQISLDQEEYRINFFETITGYRIALRVWANEFKAINTLAEVGYTERVEKIIQDISLSQSGGLIFTAQTGQGKTTTQNTLYRMHHRMGSEVVVVENPVENIINGVDQVDESVYLKADEEYKLTKSDIIDNFLRTKADVIGLGELRNSKDYADAKRVALTGHFFTGTNHTPSVLSAIDTFLTNGWSEGDIKSLIRGIVYQQLTRKLCDKCKIKEGKHYKANFKGCSHSGCSYGYSNIETPLVEIAKFPVFKDWVLKDKKTYEEYISIQDNAKEKYDLGVIDKIHYETIINGRRKPQIFEIVPREFLKEEDSQIFNTDNENA